MSHDTQLQIARVLMFVGDTYEELELWYPKYRIEEDGAHVILAGPEAEKTYLGKKGYPCKSDAAIMDMAAEDFDGLVIPGGFMPDALRRDENVLNLVKAFDKQGKMIAAICHGGWIPISAGVCRGIRMTGSLGIKDDLTNAGAVWEDSPVVIDRHFISSRSPRDLPQFGKAIIRMLASTIIA